MNGTLVIVICSLCTKHSGQGKGIRAVMASAENAKMIRARNMVMPAAELVGEG